MMNRRFRAGWLAVCLLLAAWPCLLGQEPAKYDAAIAKLTALIEHEVAAKGLPAFSIALVDDQKLIWAKGFGHQDAKQQIPASPETIYRVGSVSKLFTDIAIMQLVEKKALDLDAPVSKYLPTFQPLNSFDDKPVTLRQLMTHRSGLIREPPVGNYFDPTTPTLADTVASLNGIELVFAPESRIKYSNAGIAVVGRVLEATQGQRFEDCVKRAVLEPLGMKHSAFEALPTLKPNLAAALMWTYHGREFPAPTFELGMSPAGSMYSTVTDLATFISCVLADGKTRDGQLLQPATLAEMLKPQFAPAGATQGFGIGFSLNTLDGRKRVGHGGAVYGFATDLALLPKEKLGVVAVASRDVANGTVSRIVDEALRLLVAAKEGKPLPDAAQTSPLPEGEARRWAGKYSGSGKGFTLEESAHRLWLVPNRGGYRVELRKEGNKLRVDDRGGWGPVLEADGEGLKLSGQIYTRQQSSTPPPEPMPRWQKLIGEYGWDHNTLYIFERDGRLWALIEWTELNPLREEATDVFAFPSDRGMYIGEKLVFRRDAKGRATEVEAAHVVFKRRKVDGDEGETFRITSRRPLEELRREALAAQPPPEQGEFSKPDLVDLEKLDPTLKFDIRYATTNNFLSTPFYSSARAFLQRPAAEALLRAHRALAASGYGLMIHDGYRPWYVTKMFWDATEERHHNFVADPLKGSRHNRGCAVDLTLYELATGKPVLMVSGYDEMSDRAYPDYPGGTARQRWHRDLLRRAMEAEGFTVYEAEWWHFDYRDWKKYPIQNLSFEELDRAAKK